MLPPNPPFSPAVLVVAGSPADAGQVTEALAADIPQCRSGVDVATLAATCDEVRPDVVVVACRTLAQGQACLVSLFGGPRAVLRPYMRVVLLVHQDELRDAFTLCRQGQADDYVQFWPMPLDGWRVRMSVSLVARELALSRASLPPRPRLSEAPAADAEAPRRAADRSRELLPPTPVVDRSKPWVLLVDDDRFQYKMLRTVLAGTPLQLAWSASGADALTLLKTARPEMVLMDIHMPGLDGIETVRLLRTFAHLREVPIVMLTGQSDKERVVASLTAGANAFIVKPFSRQRLLEVAAKHLRQLDLA